MRQTGRTTKLGIDADRYLWIFLPISSNTRLGSSFKCDHHQTRNRQQSNDCRRGVRQYSFSNTWPASFYAFAAHLFSSNERAASNTFRRAVFISTLQMKMQRRTQGCERTVQRNVISSTLGDVSRIVVVYSRSDIKFVDIDIHKIQRGLIFYKTLFYQPIEGKNVKSYLHVVLLRHIFCR